MNAKLKTALLGAAISCCMISPAAIAATKSYVGTLEMAGPAEPSRAVHFDVLLPLRNKDKLEALVRAQADPSSAQYHKWLKPAEFAAEFGPARATVHRVADYLKARGFQVKEYARSVRATGTADLISRNFGAQLVLAKSVDGATHVVSRQSLSLPAYLTTAGAQILSFAPHAAHPYSQIVGGKLDVGTTRKPAAAGGAGPQATVANRYSETGPFWFDDLKQAYQYPAATDTITVGDTTRPFNGTGATITAIMSSDVLDSDIKAVFDHENWSTVSGKPDPTLAGRFYVDGGAPFVGDGATFEASLDVQQELTGAPGAQVVLTDIPDLSDGNIMAALVDLDQYNFADVVSMSFGICELFYFPAYNGGQDYRGIPEAEHELYLQGNAEGITFLASSGDEAGKECPTPSYFTGGPSHYIKSVSLPSDDPNVTSVGGTNLVTTFVEGTLDSAYAGENAWDDQEFPNDPYGVGVDVSGAVWGAGGGYSALFPAPSYQSKVTTGSTMRATPDIGMQVGGCPSGASDYHPSRHACNGNDKPQDGNGNDQRSSVAVGVAVGQGGGFYALIGTSVSSPEFAGVVAHLVEKNGRMGNLNPYIYNLAAALPVGAPRPAFHTDIPGYNGVVNTDLNSKYSLSVGVGTPIVTQFLRTGAMPQAGVPQTPSNP